MPKITDSQAFVLAAILGVSNAGSDHLFENEGKRPATFLPSDAADLARSTHSLDDAVCSIVSGLCENEEMLDMFVAEAKSWLKRFKGKSVAVATKNTGRYTNYAKAVIGEVA